MVEGSTLFLGSIVFLMYTAGHLLIDQPGIVVVFLLVVVLNVVIAGLLGLWLRACNLRVRRWLCTSVPTHQAKVRVTPGPARQY